MSTVRRRSSLSLLVSHLDPRIREKILNMNIDQDKLKKFDEEETKEILLNLTDLRNLPKKSESVLYRTLNSMFKNKQ